MKPLLTERLILRSWQDSDRELFHRINSDDQVMRYFPIRRTREESDALMDRLQGEIAAGGFGFAAIEIAESGETAGFAGLRSVTGIGVLPEGSVEIGWRLAPEHWGKGYASESARRWLQFGFADLRLPRIVSFAVRDNAASIAVMRRIGMSARPDLDFDYPAMPASRPDLRPHVMYEIFPPKNV